MCVGMKTKMSVSRMEDVFSRGRRLIAYLCGTCIDGCECNVLRLTSDKGDGPNEHIYCTTE